jgi:hypothetical protein
MSQTLGVTASRKFDSSGNYLNQWGTPGTGNGQFQGTGSIAIDSTDNVYVADTPSNRIQKFSYPAPPNQNPTIAPASASIPDTSPAGTIVVPSSAFSASDPDNDPLSYSIISGNSNNYFAINPTTGDVSTTRTNIPVGTYTITVQVDDGNGGVATSTVAITISAQSTTLNDTNNLGGINTNTPAPTLAKSGNNWIIIGVAGMLILNIALWSYRKING